MRLLQFDRSGLLASEAIDIVACPTVFVRCLIGAFCHSAGRLGFPNGPSAPRHEKVNGILRQVVTVKDKELYLIDQVSGPVRDHLVSRGTTAFKAKLLSPKGSEGDKVYCFKSSWSQKARRHEGEYLELLRDTPGVVSLLAYDVPEVELSNGNTIHDTTEEGRGTPEEPTPITSIRNFVDKKKDPSEFNSTTQNLTVGCQSNNDTNLNRRYNEAFDNREHRQTVCEWVEYNFD